MGRTVNELEQTLSFKEMLDWIDYSKVEPFGDNQDDLRNAMLCHLVSNFHYWLAGMKTPYTVDDFMLSSKTRAYLEPEPVVEERKGATIDGKLLNQLFIVSGVKTDASQ